VVVFDYGLPGGKSRMSTGGVQVVFASARSSADRVMMERINKTPNPREWIVVSSDHDVLTTARNRRMQTLTSAEFVQLLESPPKPIIDAGEAEDVHLSQEEVDEWLDLFGGDSS
jgi:hypothetical protein